MKLFFKLLLLFTLFLSHSAPTFAQAELDKFKTEEEVQNENANMGWYELAMKYGTYYFNQAYDYCVGLFTDQTAGIKQSFDENMAVINDAEKAVTDRNLAAEKRAKDIQEKTGLKGDSTNMQEVIDKKEVQYEEKSFDDINKEIKN